MNILSELVQNTKDRNVYKKLYEELLVKYEKLLSSSRDKEHTIRQFKAEKDALKRRLDKYHFFEYPKYPIDTIVFDSSDILIVYYKAKSGIVITDTAQGSQELNDIISVVEKLKGAELIGWRWVPGYKEI